MVKHIVVYTLKEGVDKDAAVALIASKPAGVLRVSSIAVIPPRASASAVGTASFKFSIVQTATNFLRSNSFINIVFPFLN